MVNSIDELKEESKKSDKTNVDADLEHAIARVRIIARAIGIWPFYPDGRTIFNILKQKFKVFILYTLLAFLVVPGYLHIFVEERIFSRRIQKMGAMILNTMAVIKYTVLLRRSNKIKHVLELLEQDWRGMKCEAHREIMRKNVNIGHRLAKLCALTFLAGATFFRLIKTLVTPSIITPTGMVIKPLPSPVYRGLVNIDLSASPNYEIAFILQLVSSVAVHSTTITTFCLAIAFVTHACGLMDIVMYMMEQLIDGNDKDNKDLPNPFGYRTKTGFNRRLQAVVELHLRILEFMTRVENLLSEIFLVEVVGGTLTLCLTGYYFIMDLSQNDAFGILTYFIMVTSLVALIFTYCYIGELLTEKAVQIGMKCYLADWHRLTGTKGRALAFIIRVTFNPVKITAGKMIPLSMYNFGGIMRSAVGYLNLLRTVAG